MKALPKEIQSICARIALERSRQALSKWAQAMLALGKDAALVMAYLDGLLRPAIAMNARAMRLTQQSRLKAETAAGTSKRS